MYWLSLGMTVAENKFLKEAIKQGLRMQDRFLAEPVLARTGKGYLKSEGVTTLQRIKANLKKSKSG
jgi:predicted DNA-binding protein